MESFLSRHLEAIADGAFRSRAKRPFGGLPASAHKRGKWMCLVLDYDFARCPSGHVYSVPVLQDRR